MSAALVGQRAASSPQFASGTNAAVLAITTNIASVAKQNFGLWIGDAGGANQIAIQFESTADGSSYPFSNFSLPQAIVQALRVLDASNFPTSGV